MNFGWSFLDCFCFQVHSSIVFCETIGEWQWCFHDVLAFFILGLFFGEEIQWDFLVFFECDFWLFSFLDFSSFCPFEIFILGLFQGNTHWAFRSRWIHFWQVHSWHVSGKTDPKFILGMFLRIQLQNELSGRRAWSPAIKSSFLACFSENRSEVHSWHVSAETVAESSQWKQSVLSCDPKFILGMFPRKQLQNHRSGSRACSPAIQSSFLVCFRPNKCRIISTGSGDPVGGAYLPWACDERPNTTNCFFYKTNFICWADGRKKASFMGISDHSKFPMSLRPARTHYKFISFGQPILLDWEGVCFIWSIEISYWYL